MKTNKKVTEFLKTILGRPVVVKLNSGVDYRGEERAPRRSWLARNARPDGGQCCGARTRQQTHASKRVASGPLYPNAAGVLACLDSFMNIAMEQTEEYVHGQLKAKYGDCFIRGNNGE